MIGLFRQRYLLAGSLTRPESPGVERPLLLTLAEKTARLLPRLSGASEVEGELDAPGFADKKPVRGRIERDAWKPLAARYEIELETNEGRPCRLLASRSLDPKDLVWSASSVSGEIVDREGRVLGTVQLRLDYRRDVKRLLVG